MSNEASNAGPRPNVAIPKGFYPCPAKYDHSRGCDCEGTGRLKGKRKYVIALARAKSQREGELEIDDNAKLSEGDDNGTYIQAWLWVPYDATPLCKDKECIDDSCPVHSEVL